MFGKRTEVDELLLEVKRVVSSPAEIQKAALPNAGAQKVREGRKIDEYHDLKRRIFGFLIEIIDVSQLAKMDHEQARAEIRDVVNEVVAAKKWKATEFDGGFGWLSGPDEYGGRDLP